MLFCSDNHSSNLVGNLDITATAGCWVVPPRFLDADIVVLPAAMITRMLRPVRLFVLVRSAASNGVLLHVGPLSAQLSSAADSIVVCVMAFNGLLAVLLRYSCCLSWVERQQNSNKARRKEITIRYTFWSLHDAA
jgi:hypothetical protein